MEQIVKKELSEIIETNIGIDYGPASLERCIPATDGLIPVLRRCLLCFYDLKLFNVKKVVKSATVVGTVIADRHPHGDASVYKTLVNNANEYFSNYPYIFGEGNWGHITGDGAAAMRYTECKASDFAYDVILKYIHPESIDWQESELGKGYPLDPVKLPTAIPLVLVNGHEGIAEAFTANFPTHNLNDIADICIKYIRNKAISVEEMAKNLYPDYPNSGIITNGAEMMDIYKTGEGKVVLKANIEINNEKSELIIRDLPYGISYATIKDNIKDQRNNKNNIIISKIIKDLEYKDENDRPYWVFMCDKNANLLEIRNELYRTTNLKKSYAVRFRLNFGKKTKLVNLKQIIEYWYEDRVRNITRNLVSQKRSLEYDIHITEGLMLISDRKDEIVEFIKNSKSKEEVISKMPDKFGISMIQAKRIAESPLHFLTKLSKNDLEDKLRILIKNRNEIEYKLTIIDNIIINQLQELKHKYGRPRRTTVTMDEITEASSKLCTSGVLLVAANSYAIFDMTAIYNSKNIVNGLKTMKLADGRVFKDIIKAIEINDEIAGLVVFYEDNTCKKIPLKDIPTFNTWISVSDDIPIIDAEPYYSEEKGGFVTITSDYKIKYTEIKDFSTIKSKCEPINCVFNPNKKNDLITFIGKNGDYWTIEDINSLPNLGKTATGVKTPFANGKNHGKLVATGTNKQYSADAYIAQFALDGTGYTLTVPLEEFQIYNREQKLKPLLMSSLDSKSELELLGLSPVYYVDIDGKKLDSTMLIIGKNNLIKLNIKNFKGKRCLKRTVTNSLNMISFNK